MRDRMLERYTDFVAFPGLTLGLVVILIDGLLGDPAESVRSERVSKANEISFAQLSRSDQDPFVVLEPWTACTVVLSRHQVDPPCD